LHTFRQFKCAIRTSNDENDVTELLGDAAMVENVYFLHGSAWKLNHKESCSTVCLVALAIL
jgi:hypothetical protein